MHVIALYIVLVPATMAFMWVLFRIILPLLGCALRLAFRIWTFFAECMILAIGIGVVIAFSVVLPAQLIWVLITGDVP